MGKAQMTHKPLRDQVIVITGCVERHRLGHSPDGRSARGTGWCWPPAAEMCCPGVADELGARAVFLAADVAGARMSKPLPYSNRCFRRFRHLGECRGADGLRAFARDHPGGP